MLAHTGQHDDENMIYVFFAELDIPHPDRHLGIAVAATRERRSE